MIEIDEPPSITCCAGCTRPVVWLWSKRARAWLKFATVSGDTKALRLDECADITKRPFDPDAAARGRALIDQALAERTEGAR